MKRNLALATNCVLLAMLTAPPPARAAAEPSGPRADHAGQLTAQAAVVLDALDADESQGWFGVHLEMPGAALERQLNLKGQGLLLTNIIRESPAEHAGVRQYDIIMSFDGADVDRDVAALATRIRQLGANKPVSLVVLRQGQPLELQTTLGIRSKVGQWQWAHEHLPNQLFTQVYSLHGKIMETNPNGELVVTDIGQIKDAPGVFRALIPEFREAQVEIWAEDGRPKEKIRAYKNRVRIEIEQAPDERIRVRRFTGAGQDEPVDEQFYDNVDSFKRADEEAYRIKVNVDAFRGAENQLDAEHPFIQVSKLHTLVPGNQERIHKIHELGNALGTLMTRAQPAAAVPAYQFQELEGGRIQVTIHKGDAQLTTTYGDAQELESKAPDLHERYVDLQASKSRP